MVIIWYTVNELENELLITDRKHNKLRYRQLELTMKSVYRLYTRLVITLRKRRACASFPSVKLESGRNLKTAVLDNGIKDMKFLITKINKPPSFNNNTSTARGNAKKIM